MRHLVLATVVAMSVGCTPGMHRAYQYTMAGMATAAFTCSTLQTRAAVTSGGPQVESNPTLGETPSAAKLGAGLGLNLAMVGAVMALPRGNDEYRNPFGDGNLTPLPDPVVDVLITATAVFAAGLAYNDNHMAPHTTCGR